MNIDIFRKFEKQGKNAFSALFNTPYQTKSGQQKARQWFDKKISDSVLLTKNKTKGKNTTVTAADIGKMALYIYDAKTKEKLPYWDMVPLVFITDVTEDGWFATNLHYLPLQLRAQLMFNLFRYLLPEKKLTPDSKLKISYQILKGYSSLKYFKPCFKRYLRNHVRSSILIIDPSEWANAAMLNIAQFQKLSESEVWAETLKQINK